MNAKEAPGSLGRSTFRMDKKTLSVTSFARLKRNIGIPKRHRNAWKHSARIDEGDKGGVRVRKFEKHRTCAHEAWTRETITNY